MNAPETFEGWKIWDLVSRMGGQVRATGGVVLGWDLGVALDLGAALGIEPMLVAELLPAIEAVMVEKSNEGARDTHG